jgi:hypothetical protein
MLSSNSVLWLGLISGLPGNFLEIFLQRLNMMQKLTLTYRMSQEEGAELKEGVKSF